MKKTASLLVGGRGVKFAAFALGCESRRSSGLLKFNRFKGVKF